MDARNQHSSIYLFLWKSYKLRKWWRFFIIPMKALISLCLKSSLLSPSFDRCWAINCIFVRNVDTVQGQMLSTLINLPLIFLSISSDTYLQWWGRQSSEPCSPCFPAQQMCTIHFPDCWLVQQTQFICQWKFSYASCATDLQIRSQKHIMGGKFPLYVNDSITFCRCSFSTWWHISVRCVFFVAKIKLLFILMTLNFSHSFLERFACVTST